jgi:3-oxoacyl-[acyl-carrier-protein] synthase III
MRFSRVGIETIAHELPETVMSSEQLEFELRDLYSRIKLPYGRLELMSGIKERRVWPIGTLPSDMAAKAAAKVLLQSKIKKDDIDLLVFTGVCRDQLEPATASRVHRLLDLPETCSFFDVSNACLGFLNGINLVGTMIESGQINNALIVTAENSGPLIEQTLEKLNNDKELTRKSIKPFFANLTIGSGAVASMVCRDDDNSLKLKLLGSECIVDTTANDLCHGGGDINSLVMETQSEKLLEHGIRLAKKTWHKTLEWNNSDVDISISHQVGQAHRDQVLNALELAQEKDFTTFEYLGNTGSAAVPLTLSKAWESGVLDDKKNLAFLGIGSGLSALMMGIECNFQ